MIWHLRGLSQGGGQKASNLRNMGLVLLLVKWAINWKGEREGGRVSSQRKNY